MKKMILISESELRGLIHEAVNNVIDGVTKKIASRAARNYNNEIFRRSAPIVESSCGSDGGGCGSTPSRRTTSYSSCGGSYDYSYGGCGSAIPSDGGCGIAIPSRSSRSSGGCGGGYESGGC